jgi:hypothetical protein
MGIDLKFSTVEKVLRFMKFGEKYNMNQIRRGSGIYYATLIKVMPIIAEKGYVIRSVQPSNHREIRPRYLWTKIKDL